MWRKKLLGVADGLMGSFLSRNNDVDGYWGMGVLSLQALERGLSSVTIRLLGTETNSLTAVEVMCEHYKRLLESLLQKAHVDRQRIKSAEITVEFGTSGSLPVPPFVTWGDPFVCTVSIADSRGRVYRLSRAARCAPHDPRKEQQRAPEK